MEKIQKFEDCKIENMQEIYGGKRTPTMNATGNQTDVKVSDGSLDYDIITNLGFVNWLRGDRTRTSYIYNSDTQSYDMD